MTDKILVTCASRTGTNAGVADAIGKTLIEEGDHRNLYEINGHRTSNLF
jgi:hypothetical protein